MAGCFVTMRSTPVGTSKRYAEHYDRRMSEKIQQREQERLAQAMTGVPATLSKEEQELDVYPLTKPPQPRAVTAWVRYGMTAVKVQAHALAWTPQAVAIEWTTPAGETHRAWVWSSAVT
jgi:hypothetical protein